MTSSGVPDTREDYTVDSRDAVGSSGVAAHRVVGRPVQLALGICDTGSEVCTFAASTQVKPVFAALADMPQIQPQTVALVADALRHGAAIARPLYQGQSGHPVGFAKQFGPALQELHDDQGARNIVAAQRHLLQLIPCDDPAVLLDIDTPTDLAALQNGGLRPPA